MTYPESDCYIRNKVKVVLDLSQYAAKKEWNHVTSVDTSSDLGAKKDMISLKAAVDKLNINKLINFPTSLNNLKATVDDVDVGTLKTINVNLKN